LYSSVHAPYPRPPKASPAFWVPAPPDKESAVIKAPPADHEVPLYSSVHDTVVKVGDPKFPPKASPAFCVPAPAKLDLPVIKAPPADHEDPLYSSVHAPAVFGAGKAALFPPKAIPAF